MPVSLKCMIDKWLHKGQISQEEYDAVMKKLDGHDKQIKTEVVDKLMDFAADTDMSDRDFRFLKDKAEQLKGTGE